MTTLPCSTGVEWGSHICTMRARGEQLVQGEPIRGSFLWLEEWTQKRDSLFPQVAVNLGSLGSHVLWYVHLRSRSWCADRWFRHSEGGGELRDREKESFLVSPQPSTSWLQFASAFLPLGSVKHPCTFKTSFPLLAWIGFYSLQPTDSKLTKEWYFPCRYFIKKNPHIRRQIWI